MPMRIVKVASSRVWSRLWLAGALVSFASVAAAAQTVSCTTGNGAKASCPTPLPQIAFTLVVPRVVQLTLSASSLNLMNNDVSATDYEAGSKSAPSLTVTAFADTAAVITMAAATTNFTAPAGVTKPASTLQASLDGTTFNGLTTAGTTVMTIAAGGQGHGTIGGKVQIIAFKTLLGYTSDPPGSYSLTINFTITAP